MPWFKVDDKLHSHPKPEACSDAAIGVWTRLGSWCCDHLTGGEVPRHIGEKRDPGGELIRELVKNGMWEETENGWLFHDWADRNHSKAQAQEIKEKRSAAGRIGGASKPKAKRKQTRSKREANTQAKGMGVGSVSVSSPEGGPGGGQTLGSALADAAMAELQRHDVLACVATEQLAQTLASVAFDHRKRPADVRGAIGVIASKVRVGQAVGEPVDVAKLASRLEGMVRKYRPDAPGEAQHEQTKAEVEQDHRRALAQQRKAARDHERAEAEAVAPADAAKLAAGLAARLAMPQGGADSA
jgi:hypothetical protein